MAGPGGRLFTSAFIALAAADLVYFTASGLLLGVTPFFVTGPLGSDKAGLGLAFGAFSVTTVIVRPLVGRMVDRLGRRRLMLAGVTMFAALIAAHLLVTDLWMLVVVRLFLGMAESLFFVAGFAALADLAPPGRTGEALSFASVALYLGIAIGPGVGQLLLDWRGFTAAWIGGTLLALLAVAMVLIVPETGEPAPEDAPARAIDPSRGDPAGTGPVHRGGGHGRVPRPDRTARHRDRLSGMERRPADLRRNRGDVPDRVRPSAGPAAPAETRHRIARPLHRRAADPRRSAESSRHAGRHRCPGARRRLPHTGHLRRRLQLGTRARTWLRGRHDDHLHRPRLRRRSVSAGPDRRPRRDTDRVRRRRGRHRSRRSAAPPRSTSATR